MFFVFCSQAKRADEGEERRETCEWAVLVPRDRWVPDWGHLWAKLWLEDVWCPWHGLRQRYSTTADKNKNLSHFFNLDCLSSNSLSFFRELLCQRCILLKQICQGQRQPEQDHVCCSGPGGRVHQGKQQLRPTPTKRKRHSSVRQLCWPQERPQHLCHLWKTTDLSRVYYQLLINHNAAVFLCWRFWSGVKLLLQYWTRFTFTGSR